MRRVLLLANPASRRGNRLRIAAKHAFRAAGVEVDEMITERPGHGRELCTKYAAQYDAVFTLGGDGTAMEIVSALAGTSKPVGVLPGGTGNLIARALGTPMLMRHAVRALLGGDVKQVDLGVLGDGRHFAFAAGVGIDARMIEATPPWLKRKIGVMAYVITAGKALLRNEKFLLRATVDGETIEREAVSVMVTNFGAVLHDRLTLGPGIRQDDGKLDLCVFSPNTMWDGLRILWRLARKDFRNDPCMLFRSGAHFRIETNPASPAQADGELIGKTPFDVRVQPLAATLLTPKIN
jgi:diacylglycerol kinase (ATP)